MLLQKSKNEKMLEYECEAEQRQEVLEDMIVNRVHGMKKVELQEALLRLLYEGPEWQWDRFVREYIE